MKNRIERVDNVRRTVVADDVPLEVLYAERERVQNESAFWIRIRCDALYEGKPAFEIDISGGITNEQLEGDKLTRGDITHIGAELLAAFIEEYGRSLTAKGKMEKSIMQTEVQGPVN